MVTLYHLQCIDKEYLSQALKLMNCSPPYLTKDKLLWCEENVNISSTNVKNFLWKFGGGIMDDGNCLIPCQNAK